MRSLLTRDEGGVYALAAIGVTVFPRDRVIVTLPGIHATQRLAYIDSLDEQRRARGSQVLTEQEMDDQCLCAVDVVIEDDVLLIRPDPAEMELAFAADELLQELFPKGEDQVPPRA